MPVILEICIRFLRKRLRIGYLLGIVVHVLKGSDSPVIIQGSCFSVLGPHFPYSEIVSAVDSSEFGKCELPKLFLSLEHLFEPLGSDLHFLEI